MKEETQEASQESEVVTDDMLNRAADGVDEVEEVATEDETTEETTEEEEAVAGEEEEEETTETEEEVAEEAEEAPEEPEDNAERSRLGRRVSEVENAILQSTEENRKLNETLQKLTGVLGKKEEAEEEEFFELPETKEDLGKLIKEQVDKVRNEEVSQVSAAAKEYEQGYTETVMNLLDGDPDSAVLIDLIQSEELNIKHSKVNSMQGGVLDAAKNIMAAKSQLSQGTAKKIPLKSEKGKKLGGGGGDQIPKVAQKMPKLDAAAAQFVKDTNMTPEKVIKVFG